MDTLKDRLKKAFTESGFRSQAELCRRAGIKSASTVSELFRGNLGEESPALTALALVLNVNAIWLQRGRGPMRGSGPTLVDIAALDAPETKLAVAANERKILDDLSLILAAYNTATPHGRKQLVKAAAAVEKMQPFQAAPESPSAAN